MPVTPERGPETELTQTVENQRTGHEPEDLLREPEAAQAEREQELLEDKAHDDKPS